MLAGPRKHPNLAMDLVGINLDRLGGLGSGERKDFHPELKSTTNGTRTQGDHCGGFVSKRTLLRGERGPDSVRRAHHIYLIRAVRLCLKRGDGTIAMVTVC